MMTYQQAQNIKKEDRVRVYGSKGWVTGTVISKGMVLGSPVIWVEEDGYEDGFSSHYIGTNLTERSWNELKAGKGLELLEEQAGLF